MVKLLLKDWKTFLGFCVIAGIALGISIHRGSPTYFGIALVILLLLRLLAGIYGKSRLEKLNFEEFTGTSTLIIPFYNEDPQALNNCLISVLNNTKKVTTVVVIDDASSNPAGYALAKSMEEQFMDAGINYDVIKLTENKGKRNGLALGFIKHPADVYIGVDSDTVVDKYGIDKLLQPLSDERVTATTGVVLAANAKKNLLTRMIDLRYASSFLLERASYSAFGSVLCCCGSLAAYRGSVVLKNVNDFITQTFLGVPAVAGDDRRLTNYCLQEGRVLLVEDARAETLVPEKLSHYLRQQVRWSKSFWRETMWVLTHFKPSHPAWVLSFVELMSWVLMTSVLVLAVYITPAATASWALLSTYVIFVVIMAYARSVRYFSAHNRQGMWVTFLLAPAYGFLHVGLLLPLRFYALATIKKNSWGTRKAVEVTSS